MKSEKTTQGLNGSKATVTKSGIVFLQEEEYLRLAGVTKAVENARIKYGDNPAVNFINDELVITIPSQNKKSNAKNLGSSESDTTEAEDPSDPENPSDDSTGGEDAEYPNSNDSKGVSGGGNFKIDEEGTQRPVEVTYDSDGNQYIDGYATFRGAYGEAEFTWTLTAGFPEYEPWVMVYDGGTIRYEKSVVIDTPTGPARSTVQGDITLTTNGEATLVLRCTGDSRLAGHFWYASGGYGPSPELATIGTYGVGSTCSVSAAGGSATFNIYVGLIGYFCAHNINYDSAINPPAPNLANAYVGSRYHPGSCYGRTLLKYYNDTQLGNKKLRVTNFTSAKHDHLATIKLLTWDGSVLSTVENVNLKTSTPTNYTVNASMAKIEQCWIAEFATSDHTTPTLTITSNGYNMWHTYDEYKIRVIESRLFTTVKKLGSNQANVGNGGVTTVTTGQTQLTDDSS